jgi:hypothetical protein
MERARNFVALVATERAGTARTISRPLPAPPPRRRPVRSSGIAIAAPLAWWLLPAGPMVLHAIVEGDPPQPRRVG